MKRKRKPLHPLKREREKKTLKKFIKETKKKKRWKNK